MSLMHNSDTFNCILRLDVLFSFVSTAAVIETQLHIAVEAGSVMFVYGIELDFSKITWMDQSYRHWTLECQKKCSVLPLLVKMYSTFPQCW